jgi:hypothetical protein
MTNRGRKSNRFYRRRNHGAPDIGDANNLPTGHIDQQPSRAAIGYCVRYIHQQKMDCGSGMSDWRNLRSSKHTLVTEVQGITLAVTGACRGGTPC